MSPRLLALGMALYAGAAEAQTPFQLTLTNTSAANWDQGLLAILPFDQALLPIGQSPTSGDPYDTYAMVHTGCDPYGVEDDADITLLIARWNLVEGMNAFRVGPLGPGQAQAVSFTAVPGQVVSFVAHTTGSGDDAAIMHAFGNRFDATVDLFDGSGVPFTNIAFGIDGYDVNDLSAAGNGGSCTGTCPPSVPCYVSPGGGANGASGQPVTGGCTAVAWYADLDGDGVGGGLSGGLSCTPPPGSVSTTGDCNDSDPDVWASCGACVDADLDGSFVGCDAYSTRPGPDCDDADSDNQFSCATCQDLDLDGVFAGCDGYLLRPGPDCSDADADNWASCTSCVDQDGDSSFVGCDRYLVRTGPDCDDTNALLNAGTVWLDDADGDGFGDDATAAVQCAQPPGAVLVGGDCDDTDAAVSPGATEVCGGGDEDCDGLVDDADPSVDPGSATTWFGDADLDGYGNPAASVAACVAPPGTVSNAGDCDDGDVDNWASCLSCLDGDGDGSFAGCDAYTTRTGPDCDDANPLFHPGTVWYADADGDAAGDLAATTVQCDPLPGAVLVAGDCDDTDPTAFPGALEVCDGDDEDCDGLVDDADPDLDPLTTPTWYDDLDLDGYGDVATELFACQQPVGSVDDGTDCDDADADNWASCATCVDGDGDGSWIGCDAYDARGGPDCDDTDPLLNTGTVWFDDLDGDGAGDPATASVQCTPPPGGVLVGGDCDDADPSVNPGAIEVCGGLDEDCDGLVDDADPDLDPGSAGTWYTDADGDGHGDPATATLACAGQATVGDDCDDAAADTFPGADETCDGRDQDCDGVPDNAAIDAGFWYADADADGFGDDATGALDCAPDPSDVLVGGDCDDGDAGIWPGALEFCDNRDQDCDGVVDDNAIDASTWYPDGDGDGFGDGLLPTLLCVYQPGYTSDATDCDDGAAAVNPAAQELCDGLDNDCDADVDEGLPLDTWWADADGDDFGDPAGPLEACAQPADSADNDADCDDTDPGVHPDAVELPANGIDEDCDGIDPSDTGVPIPGASDRPWTPRVTDSEPSAPGPAGCDCDQGGAGGSGLALLALLGLTRRR